MTVHINAIIYIKMQDSITTPHIKSQLCGKTYYIIDVYLFQKHK